MLVRPCTAVPRAGRCIVRPIRSVKRVRRPVPAGLHAWRAVGCSPPGTWTLRLKRHASSNAGGSDDDDWADARSFECVPFQLTCEDAVRSYERWWKESTPAGRWSLLGMGAAPPPVRVQAVFLPFWAMEAAGNVEIEEDWGVSSHHEQYWAGRSVPASTAKATQHYGGHAYRRSIVNDVRLPSLDDAVPLTGRHLTLRDGSYADVDAWSLSEAQGVHAIQRAIVSNRFEEINEERAEAGHYSRPKLSRKGFFITFSDLSTRRVYLPAFVIEFKRWGEYYRVFVSGRKEGGVGGLTGHHTLVSATADTVSRAVGALSFSLPFLGPVAGSIRLVMTPVVLIPAFAYTVYNLFRVRLDRRHSFQEWHRTRDKERRERTEADVRQWQHRRSQRTQEEYRAEWEARHAGSKRTRQQASQQEREARERHERQQARQQREREQAQQRRRRTSQKTAGQGGSGLKKPSSVDPTDLYALLGLPQRSRATTEQIGQAFRREMFKYHPDHAGDDLDPAAANERTRHILAAYRTLRNPAKRREYDRRHG